MLVAVGKRRRGSAEASGQHAARGRRESGEHGGGWRFAAGAANLPAAAESAIGLDQAERDLALRLRQRVFLLHFVLLNQADGREGDVIGLVPAVLAKRRRLACGFDAFILQLGALLRLQERDYAILD